MKFGRWKFSSLRKGFLLVTICLLGGSLICVASASAEFLLIPYHHSGAHLMDGKTVYDGRFFDFMEFELFDGDTPATQKHLDARGTFTIYGGRYTIENTDEVVNGTDKVFKLCAPWIEDGFDFLSYSLTLDELADEEDTIFFAGQAETGLPGKRFSWNFPSLGKADEGTVPVLRTTEEQYRSYLPYFELIRSGGKVTGLKWRMMNPKSSETSQPLNCKTKIRVTVNSTSWKRIAKSKTTLYQKGEAPSGELIFEAPVEEAISGGFSFVLLNLLRSVMQEISFTVGIFGSVSRATRPLLTGAV